MTDAVRINFAFLDHEDRLAVEVLRQDEATTFLLTRRVVRRLIRAVADLLVTSSAVMARAPLDMRKEVIVFEHLSATQAEEGGETPPSDRPPPPAQRRSTLTRSINIETHPQYFALALIGESDIAETLSLSRAELHRLLACLHQLARRAEWDIDGESAWLAAVQEASMEPPPVKC